MRVPLFEFDGWTCEFTRNGHRFTRNTHEVILVRHGANRRLTVQRDLMSIADDVHPPVYGDPTNGGVQGGGDINLRPKWFRGNREAMDGTIERHAIASFTADGTPTPAWPGKRYALTQDSASPYKRIDGPHYIRAYEHAVAQWHKDRDPVARFWLILCAFEVLRRFPLLPFTDHEGPEYSLATMYSNVHGPALHSGALGIQRENAHCLRCVVEAQRAAPSELFKRWIVTFVDMLYMGGTESGALERHRFGDGLAQEEDDARSLGMKANEEWCTSWQTPYMVVAVGEAMKVVRECNSHGLVVLQRMRRLWDAAFVPGDVYDGVATVSGLPRYLVVAVDGNVLPRITRGYGPARATWDGDAWITFQENGL